MKVTRRLRSEKSDDELSDAQYSVLAALAWRGSATPRALAEFERVQPPSMTRTLASLVERGLVDRTEDPNDRRSVIVGLTGDGELAVKETKRRRDAWLAQRLATLTHHEREVLAEAAQILRRIAEQ